MTRIDVCRCPVDGHPAHDPQPPLPHPDDEGDPRG